MAWVISYVAEHPGCVMMHAAEWVAPRGSLMYGYRTVHRVIDAGLVRTERGPRNSIRLFPKEES